MFFMFFASQLSKLRCKVEMQIKVCFVHFWQYKDFRSFVCVLQVLRIHSKASSPDFLIYEGDKIRRLVQQYIEYTRSLRPAVN